VITPYGNITSLPDDNPQLRQVMEAGTRDRLIARELFFFQWANAPTLAGYEGPGRYQHARMLADMIWRSEPGKEAFRWHPDMETSLEEFCRTNEVVISGPASAGKTFAAALFAVLFWLCAPQETGVLGCSTTLRGLKERLWSEMRMLYTRALPFIGKIGRLVDSDLQIQSYKGATKHGIFGLAVAQGEEQKALDRIIGFHPRRVLVIMDELTGIPWAIIAALTNLFTAKQKAQAIGLGNACYYFDSHGQMCEPKDGWNSVTVDSERWETKRGGICLHYDGFKSPNITAGKIIYDFLLSQADIDKTEKEYGMDSPQMWRFRRGFWCPEGTTKTVLNDSLIRKFMAMDYCLWEGPITKWAGLDPAFEGGDRCVLRFAVTGKSDAGIDTLEFEKPVVIKPSVTAKDPLHYQIARQVREECIARGVDIRHFGMDVTGEGGALASIIAEEWSPGMHQVEFGGKASDHPVSEINRKPCSKEYFDKVTELWFTLRIVLMLGQIRGLDAETAAEFCSRLYVVDGITWVESKREMKARPGARSPDNADACCVVLDMVKHRGGLGKVVTRVQSENARQWREVYEKAEEEEEIEFCTDGIEAVL
jgi:hypothetical protein